MRLSHRLFPGLTPASLLLPLLLLFVPLREGHAQDLKIGIAIDQSSVNADIARDYLAGARTWFDHINSQGGINGRRINLVVKDDEGDAAKTLQLTRQLIEADKVDALFGYVGDEGLALVAADSTFRQARIALYAPLSGADLGKTPDSVFYVRPTYRDEARYLIKHFMSLGNTRFAILTTNGVSNDKLANQVADELKMAGASLVGRLAATQDSKAGATLAKRMLELNAQVVIVTADTLAMADFLKRFRGLDKGTSVIGFSTVNHRTLLELAKPEFAASTMLTQVVPHPDLPLTKVQTEHLQLMAKYRDEPPSHVTLEGFIAAKAFVSAIKGGTFTRSGILASVSGDRRLDVGGIYLTFTTRDDRGSKFVDLAFLRRTGRLIQ